MEPSDADLTRIWNRVEVTVEAESGSRRRLVRVVVGAAIGAAVLGTSAVAAAELYSAHTGKGPVDAEDRRLGGPGERLDPAAPDYGTVVDEQTDDIPFPDPAAREVAIRDQLRDASHGDALVSTGALRAWVADAALCAWSNQWAGATTSGNAGERAEAIGVIQMAPSWPAVVAIDPQPYSRTKTMDVTNENGETRTQQYQDESQFYYLADLGVAVEGDDVGAVADLLAENNGYCTPKLVPNIPKADPLFRGR